MDVLCPEIQEIDGICYRINPGEYLSNVSEKTKYYVEDEGENIPSFLGEDIQDDCEIEVDKGGRFKIIFKASKTYIPLLVGSKGITKKRIESETMTRITISKMGQDGDIVITGSEKKDIIAAKRRMMNIVKSARRRQPSTHFISFPLTSSSFKNGFLKFKNDILLSCQDRGINESIFKSVDKLHLTLCVLVLTDDRERKCASTVLENCKEDIICPMLGKTKLNIIMSGIDCMNDDPSEVEVLFAKVICKENPEFLQQLADNIVSYFVDQELVDQKYDRVKLHVTLMNANSVKGAASLEETKGKRETFDARTILNNFRDFYFGEGEISTIDLSLRFSTSDSGYYSATASLSLP